jgi:predicted phage terminase large subunit-like protein
MQRFDLTSGGSYFAAGRGAAITGRGAHLMIIDDPLKDRDEAYSDAIRRGLHEWFASVAYTRLQPGGAIILVCTRWHEDDLAGHLLREQVGDWDVISMPAIAEEDDAFRKQGEALWPAKYPLAVLEEIRASIGGAAWASLYQQRPSAAEGAVFRREWWRTYHDHPPFRRIVQSWDTAFKANETNDYSACTTWGEAESGYYLLWAWRDRCEFPALKRKLQQWAEEWRPNAILVEDRASGQSLLQELGETRWPVLPVKTDSDKVSRAQAVTPMIEAGKVFLPDPATAPWLADYMDELSAFPAGLHDDWTDSTTQALNYLRQRHVAEIRITELEL